MHFSTIFGEFVKVHFLQKQKMKIVLHPLASFFDFQGYYGWHGE